MSKKNPELPSRFEEVSTTPVEPLEVVVETVDVDVREMGAIALETTPINVQRSVN
jgi:hypothetical protein